jgi:UDP-glucose 4-epimerase
MIATQLGFTNLAPRYFASRPQEVKEAICLSDLARSVLGYKTCYSLEESIRYLIDYIVKIGPRKFNYDFSIEIENEKCPIPWTQKCFND